jgi:hypothetical protein
MYGTRCCRILVGCLGLITAAGCAGTTTENVVAAPAQLKNDESKAARSLDRAARLDESDASNQHDADAGVEGGEEPAMEAAPLDCSRGEGVHAEFGCDSVLTSSCKDLSNVVLEFADGVRQRFEGLHGYSSTFAGTDENEGKVIVRVWIKSGANHSGEGPGYGTRFDADGNSCGEVPEVTPEPESDSEHCGEVPDEFCSEPTPPAEPCDPQDSESECFVAVPG